MPLHLKALNKLLEEQQKTNELLEKVLMLSTSVEKKEVVSKRLRGEKKA